jgi:hypothetical protein
MTVWRNGQIGVERDGLKIRGLEVWKHKWRSTGEPPLDLPHTSYPNQTHPYGIYEIEDGGHSFRFAAGELSNGVCFCIPE